MDKGLPTFADLSAAYKRKSGETAEAKRERREQRRKNKRRNRQRRDDESAALVVVGTAPNDEGYIDDNDNTAGSAATPFDLR